jgi:hypothetical protein
MHPKVTYQEIEEFFDDYFNNTNIGKIITIYNVGKYNMLFFNKALEQHFLESGIIQSGIIEGREIIPGQNDKKHLFQYVRFSFLDRVEVTLTEANERINLKTK